MTQKKNDRNQIIISLLIFILLLALALCIPSKEPVSTDILSQKKPVAGKTQLTILVKYAFSINSFEKAVEEKFPEIDIVQVGNYTHNMGINEYESRLKNDDLTDIVMTWPIDVGEEYWEDRLLDLSGLEFTSHYNLSTLNDIAKDGKLYYLPGPAQVRGIVYNKTLFQEKGWQLPTDFNSFIELCKTIEASGMRSLQLGLGNSEVLDTAFIGYNYGNVYSKPQDVEWIENYNDGKGSFGDHFSSALDVYQKMVDEGIWKKEDLNIQYQDREKMLFTRKCAMVEDSVLMARMGYNQTGTTDEYALMPFFNPGIDNEWARLYNVCFIGLNKHLAEPGNKEKYDLAIKLMDYVSTEDGQKSLAGDTGAMFSSLVGVAPPDVPEIQSLIPTLNHGRYAVFPELENAQDALRKGLTGMLKGEISKENVIKMVDAQNLSPPVNDAPEVLGNATKDFTLIETGNFVTDAMRDASGCEIALFLDNGKDGKYNGKGISGRFYKGDITSSDVQRVFPDLKHNETGTLWKIKMSGEDLIKTLEYSIPVDNNAVGWFYYFSGLQMEYDPTAEAGSRIHKITTTDGQSIDPQKEYSIAVMDESVSNEFIRSCEKTNLSIIKIIENAVKKSETIAPSEDGRFVIPKV